MAKAKAICTCERCGKTFEVTTIRSNRRDADSWERWAAEHYTLCDACTELERKEEAAKLAAQAAADGLPALVGSEKQVVWAEQLRAAALAAVGAQLAHVREKGYKDHRYATVADLWNMPDTPAGLMEWEKAFAHILKTQNQARFWIDARHPDILEGRIEETVKQLRANAMKQAVDDTPTANDVKQEATVYPAEQKHAVAEIIVSDSSVSVRYPLDEAFREVVKGAGFAWSKERRVWYRSISWATGSAVDRAADVGNRLLRAGFAIMCTNADVRRMAVDGTFEPECKRWVSKLTQGQYSDGWLAIGIPAGDQQLYKQARMIPDSRWSDGFVVVPIARHQLVSDFADIHGYRFSPGALEQIAKYEQARAQAVAPVTPSMPAVGDKLKAILESDDAALDDLKDPQ